MGAALSAFYPGLLMEVPGCPDPVIDYHLREIARIFCRKSSFWRADLDPIDLVAGRGTYSLDSPESASTVERITQMILGTELLWDDTDATAASTQAPPSPRYPCNQPPFSVAVDHSEFTLIDELVPTAAVSEGLLLKGALVPSRTATTLPDFLIDQFSEAIRFGVLSRLMAMGEKPWTDRPLAMSYATQWESAINFAAYQGSVGNTRKTLRVKQWG